MNPGDRFYLQERIYWSITIHELWIDFKFWIKDCVPRFRKGGIAESLRKDLAKEAQLLHLQAVDNFNMARLGFGGIVPKGDLRKSISIRSGEFIVFPKKVLKGSEFLFLRGINMGQWEDVASEYELSKTRNDGGKVLHPGLKPAEYNKLIGFSKTRNDGHL